MSAFASRLAARNLGYRIGGRTVLDDISFELGDGALVALLGANGAGKTTLLRLLLGLLAPSSGEVLLEGKPLSFYRRKETGRRIAYVPQSHAPIFPYLVGDVVALGRLPWATVGRGLSASDRQAAEAAMARLSIVHLSQRPYTQLSGGERQSVLIARALAQGARVLIMDEPATGLDFGQQLRLAEIMRGLAREGLTVLSTTHDPIRARTSFDRAIMLDHGKVFADGNVADIINESAVRTIYDLGDGRFPPLT
jgi:iron complex transport system ATP-binding protein